MSLIFHNILSVLLQKMEEAYVYELLTSLQAGTREIEVMTGALPSLPIQGAMGPRCLCHFVVY